VLSRPEDADHHAVVRKEVNAFMKAFPLYAQEAVEA
jgi:hypothetical protein